MFGIWVIAIGLAMLILGIWSWRGRTWRSRWWTRGHNGDGFLCFGPTVSLLTLGFGIAFLAESLHFDALYAAGAVVVLGGFLVFLYSGLVMLISPIWWPAQKAWGPRWYSRQTEDQIYGTDPEAWGDGNRQSRQGKSADGLDFWD